MTRSFSNIFSQGDVKFIEIPIIQRDYAQGRQDGAVPRIRKAFLKVLHGALPAAIGSVSILSTGKSREM